MTKIDRTLPYPKPRKYRRYELRYPVRVQVGSGKSISELEATSKNVSIGGLLLSCKKPIQRDASVLLTMTIEGNPIVRAIQLKARGRVVRVTPAKPGYAIAIECIRPITQMEEALSASG